MSLAYFPSISRIVGPLVIGSGGAQISADSSGQITAKGVGTKPFVAGGGLPAGAPSGTITLATGGAGVLTGVYKYAYTETDGTGETTISAQATYTASSEKIQVTVPLPRRGMSTRKVYRTAAGGTTFKLVHSFGGGDSNQQTIWVDNTADGSLGATAPSSDTTQVFEVELNQSVKFLRTHPSIVGAADVTVLTGDVSTAGAYGIDVYGEYLGRTVVGNTFGSLKTGTSGNHILCRQVGTTDDGSSPTNVFTVTNAGCLKVQPLALTDQGDNGLRLEATLPTVGTNTNTAAFYSITGAGSSAFNQVGLEVDFLAGYTGSAVAYGLRIKQQTANTGVAHGLYATTTGAAATCVGVTGRASGGTSKSIGVWGGLGIDPDGFSGSFATGCSNSSTTSDLFRAYDNAALQFRIRDGGALVLTALNISQTDTGDFWHDTNTKALKFWPGTTVHTVPGVIATQTSDVTIASTAAETTALGTVTGTKTLAAAFFVAGKTVRCTARGYVSNTGTPTLEAKAKLGSTALVTTGAITTASGLSNTGWELIVEMTCRTTGASGTVMAQGVLRIGTTIYPMVATAATTIDTTGSLAADVTITWGTSSGSNTLTCSNFSLEVLN